MTREEKALQYFLDRHRTSTYKEAITSKENAQILIDTISKLNKVKDIVKDSELLKLREVCKK